MVRSAQCRSAERTAWSRVCCGGQIGQIAADVGPVLRAGPVVDPSSFARTTLIEAPGRAGISVSATPTGPNPAGKLPAQRSYQGDHRMATYVSPPFREYATLILKVSHNLGAHLVVCLMAVKAGGTDCDDGFAVMRSLSAAPRPRRPCARRALCPVV